jgi:CheY-like chemotaxis protein
MQAITFSILVVDDDEDDRLILDEAFKEIGYEQEVKKFIDGDSLIHYLNKIMPSEYPSLIVLDSALPKLDVTEILRLLKNNSQWKDIPVLVYSTSVSPSKREQLLNLGATACIEKGNVMQEVIAIAKEMRNRAEAESNKTAGTGNTQKPIP